MIGDEEVEAGVQRDFTADSGKHSRSEMFSPSPCLPHT